MDEQEYLKLLKKARSELPAKVFEKTRFKIPLVDSLIQGKKTVFNNFNKFPDVLNRPREHLIKFLTKELGTTAALLNNRLIIVGKFSPTQLNEKIKKYVNEFVKCSECSKPDTKLLKEDRIVYIKCMACGAKKPVRTL